MKSEKRVQSHCRRCSVETPHWKNWTLQVTKSLKMANGCLHKWCPAAIKLWHLCIFSVMLQQRPTSLMLLILLLQTTVTQIVLHSFVLSRYIYIYCNTNVNGIIVIVHRWHSCLEQLQETQNLLCLFFRVKQHFLKPLELLFHPDISHLSSLSLCHPMQQPLVVIERIFTLCCLLSFPG